jgi:Cobalamin adenosyltransferase
MKDELNAVIGIAREHCALTENGLEEMLKEIQSRLFDLGAAVATPVQTSSSRKKAYTEVRIILIIVILLKELNLERASTLTYIPLCTKKKSISRQSPIFLSLPSVFPSAHCYFGRVDRQNRLQITSYHQFRDSGKIRHLSLGCTLKLVIDVTYAVLLFNHSLLLLRIPYVETVERFLRFSHSVFLFHFFNSGSKYLHFLPCCFH